MENYHRHQKLKQLSKQTQLVDQNFSNGIMLNALAALENLAIYYGYKGKRIFDYYSGYARRDSDQELVNAVVLQLEIFRSSHYNYTTVYSSYDFPTNLTNEQVIKHVKDWKKHIPKQIEIYYDEMLNYLYGNSNVSGITNIIEKKKKEMGPTTEEDLARVGRAAPFVNTDMFNQMDKVKQSYEKKGDFEIKAHLNRNQDENAEMKDLNVNDQNYVKQAKIFHQIEKEIETFFYRVCQNFQVSSLEFNMFNKNVEQFQNFITGMNPGESEILEKINLYKSYIDNIAKKCGTLKDNDINKLIEICEGIIKLYSSKKQSQIA